MANIIDTPAFADIDDFRTLGYNPDGYEEYVEHQLHSASDFLRTEAEQRGLLDKFITRWNNSTSYHNSVIGTVCAIVNKALQNLRTADSLSDTEYENVKQISFSQEAGAYRESKGITFADSTNIGSFVLKNDLERLGLNSAKIRRIDDI